MKLKDAAASSRGSFGIPPEVHPDRAQRPHTEKASDESPSHGAAPAPSFDDGFEEVDSDEAESTDTAVAEEKKTSPRKVLAEMGVTLTGEDWSSYYYKGYMEKRVLVAQVPQGDNTLSPLYVTYRTVTAEQGDLADQLLAEEVDSGKMTMEGVANRREMWNLAFAVLKIGDRPIVRDVFTVDPKTKEKTFDAIGTARAKRKLLSQMAPMVVDNLSRKYWSLLTQIRLLMENPKNNFLE